MRRILNSFAAAALTVALTACVDGAGGPTASAPAPTTTADITTADFASRIQILADDRFEGRGPGTAKGEAAADWIAAELKRLGLKPGANGSYFQDVPAASI